MHYLARLRIRVIASIVDQFIFSILLIFFFLVFPDTINDGPEEPWQAFIIMVGFWVFYFPLSESISGQTIAKKLFKLKVLKENGDAAVFGDTIIRRLLDLVDFLFFGLVGLLIANSNKKKQRMGDMMAKTIVVNESVTACAKCGSPLGLYPEAIDSGVLKCPKCAHELNLSQPPLEANVPPA